MMIDEAIVHAREVAKREDMCAECRAEHEQLAEWLEELKSIKNGFTDDLLNMGFTKGYNKAIDDFVAYASTMPTVEEDDGEIRPMWMEEIAEQLKAGASNE